MVKKYYRDNKHVYFLYIRSRGKAQAKGTEFINLLLYNIVRIYNCTLFDILL